MFPNNRFLQQLSKPNQVELKKYNNRFVWAKQLLGGFFSPRDQGWRSHMPKVKQGDYIGCRQGVMMYLSQAGFESNYVQKLTTLGGDLGGWQL